MKKIITSIFVLFSLVWTTFADYYTESINSFISSPNASEIVSIEDKNLAYCENIFLRAYMRRKFTDIENQKCSDVFEQKIEAQMNYMKHVMWQRGIY